MHDGKRVAVLMGGPSQEHAISLKSGHGVEQALAAAGWQVDPLIIPQFSTAKEAASWTESELKRLMPSVAFIALHGTFGEDGTVQTICEKLDLPYTGSDARTSRIGMDKLASRQRFVEAGLDVPAWRKLDARHWFVQELEGLEYPLVVKPVDQGSSIGVSIVETPEMLEPAVKHAAQYGNTILVDAFIRGRELTVGVLGDRALPVVEVVPKTRFFDFTAKYTAGMTEYHVPADLPPAIAAKSQEAGLRAHQALGCRHLSRADMILDVQGRCVILEVNTIPGFTPTSLLPKAAAHVGISYADVCGQLVDMALSSADRPRKLKPVAGAR